MNSPAASRGRYFFFCSSVPASRIGRPPSGCAPKFVVVPAHAQPSSSATRESARHPMAVPPYASGTQMPNRPDSTSARIDSVG
jgi:hypothetical protein